VGCAVGRAVRAALALSSLALLASACGVANDLGNTANGPLGVLKVSDTVVETNLQTAGAATDGIGSGVATTTGPSLSYHVVSVSSGAGRPTVLVGFNQLSGDCLGLVQMLPPGATVLGESQSGPYYFWSTGTTGPACDAASFAAMTTVPSGWAAGDPSSSGWPL
jgi:hypothetical protein